MKDKYSFSIAMVGLWAVIISIFLIPISQPLTITVAIIGIMMYILAVLLKESEVEEDE
jgi:uncharacterized protein YhhL (DUF1145 family)